MSEPVSGSARKEWINRSHAVAERGRSRAERSLFSNVWQRMLETEFVDRSVALAGKAFISFFPLVIVVAAFMPPSIRSSILATLTSRLGLRGDALALTKQAFTTTDDIRRATGFLGLIMTVFFASSFTTALQRVYMRAWRRPRNLKLGSYTRGIIWLVALLLNLAVTGAIGRALGAGATLAIFVPLALLLSVLWWWFTAWYLLLGHVRWRALLPGAVISAVAMIVFAISASVWMPSVVTKNLNQFGFFGVALALVTWFSGASMCLIVGACAGAVFSEDTGAVGQLSNGGNADLLVEGAPPSLGPPVQAPSLRDAFKQMDEDIS